MPIISNNPNSQAGLVKASPSADTPNPVRTTHIADPKFKGVAVDTRWVNRSNLLTHVEGYSWVLKAYYSQVLNSDSQLSGQQVTVSAQYQPYKKINGMELKVQSPLTTSQDDASKGMNMQGSSLIYPNTVIPNEGDMMVADIGEGRLGVFRVTDTIKKTIYENAVYEIEYSINSDETLRVEDLDAKVVEEVYFHKEYLTLGRDPLLVNSEHNNLLAIQEVYDALARQYFQRFFSDEYKTLLIPLQQQSTYDYFLVDFLLSQFDTTDSQEIRYIRKLAMGGDPAMQSHSLWTALKERDPVYLKTAFQKAGVVTTKIFVSTSLVNSIRYTGIPRAIYPIDAQLVINNQMRNNACGNLVTPLIEPLQHDAPPMGGLYQMVEAITIANATPGEGTVKPVATDEYYVLSEDFYKKTAGMSTLESVVWKFLEREPMDVTQLVGTAKLWPTWGYLEQCYYIPILMHLMKSIIQGDI